MKDEVVVFSRQWVESVAVSGLLQGESGLRVYTVYSESGLEGWLDGTGNGVVVLGMSPHEDVEILSRLGVRLSGRKVVFVGRKFYWTDYMVPYLCGIKGAGFCTLDMLPVSAGKMSLRRMMKSVYPGCVLNELQVPVLREGIEKRQLLWWLNFWLSRCRDMLGVTAKENDVLLALSEGRQAFTDKKKRSVLKSKGLEKLGEKRHAVSLYRGIVLRPELQRGREVSGE
ncbi:hypothetical protein ACDA27_004667 [Salmonella enterica]